MKLRDYSLQPTTWLKPLYWYFSGSAQKGKKCSKISKTPKNLLITVSQFLGFNKTDSRKKNFLLVFWNSWKYLKERSVMVPRIFKIAVRVPCGETTSKVALVK